MTKLRVPVIASVGIEAFSGTSFTSLSSYMKNAIVNKYGPGEEERPYITQRPGINLYTDASDTITDEFGRGVYYWPTTDTVYIVNNDTVYTGSYATILGTITGGSERVEFAEIGTDLVILDSKNDEAWYVDNTGTFAQITDDGFPTGLVHGAVVLDNYLFVLDNQGTIWNSDLEDATTSALPAVITGDSVLTTPPPTIDADNDTFDLNVDGSGIVTVSIPHGTYPSLGFAEIGIGAPGLGYTIQGAIDTALGSKTEVGATLSLNDTGDGYILTSDSFGAASSLAITAVDTNTTAELGFSVTSSTGTVGAWNPIDFITAEREPDGGVSIVKHHDHIVVFGNRTIEFFYNAANPVGSPLSRRSDIYYNVGCISGNAVWQQGDRIYFVGTSPQGHYGVYEIANFKISKISTPELDSYLTTISIEESSLFFGNGFSARGHDFYILTPYSKTNTVTIPQNNLVFDAFARMWYLWDSEMPEISGLNSIPVVSWTIGSSENRFGQGILTNGDLITIDDMLGYVDKETTGVKYIEGSNDYIASGYVVDNASVDTNIKMISRFSHKDEGTNDSKFIRTLTYIGDYTPSAQNLLIRYSDTADHATFQSDRILDLSKKQKLSRLGYTERRTWEIEYEGSATVRIEGLEMEVEKSNV